MKAVIFDLDETLGYFVQLSFLWDAIHLPMAAFYTNDPSFSQRLLHSLLDLYPEYIRPGILPILQYVKEKKEAKVCHKVFLYTNNSRKKWGQMIVHYLEEKLGGGSLFDRVISSKEIEQCRTSQNKTHKDLIRCTKLPPKTHICFLDDSFFPEMVSDPVYYIHLKPYFCDLEPATILQRFNTVVPLVPMLTNIQEIRVLLQDALKQHESLYASVVKGKEEYEIERILSKQILRHLHTFFQMPEPASHQKRNKTMSCKPDARMSRGTRRIKRKK